MGHQAVMDAIIHIDIYIYYTYYIYIYTYTYIVTYNIKVESQGLRFV